jgi:hypothetical protein
MFNMASAPRSNPLEKCLKFSVNLLAEEGSMFDAYSPTSALQYIQQAADSLVQKFSYG